MGYYGNLKLHDWKWVLNPDRTPKYGRCLVCKAEKHWDDKRHKWGAAMLKGDRQPLCK